MSDIEPVLDVTQIAMHERHTIIFNQFDRMEPGKSFILQNDHDPRPLGFQFRFEREGEFSWEYLQKGPDVWKVRIGKLSKS
jgi:uncharacterized protein (DUF2249 family)